MDFNASNFKFQHCWFSVVHHLVCSIINSFSINESLYFCSLLNMMLKNNLKWQRRTGDAVDGCAIFWKADKWGSYGFSCIHIMWNIFCILLYTFIGYVNAVTSFLHSVRFRLIDEENIKFKRFNLRDNVAQLSVLEVESYHHVAIVLSCLNEVICDDSDVILKYQHVINY